MAHSRTEELIPTNACSLGASILEVQIGRTNSKVKSQWLKKEMKKKKGNEAGQVESRLWQERPRWGGDISAEVTLYIMA